MAAATATTLLLLVVPGFLLGFGKPWTWSGDWGAAGFGIVTLLCILYLILGSLNLAASASRPRGEGLRWRTAALATTAVAGFLVTIVWLVWADGAHWPMAEGATYLAWVAGMAGLWALLMPGAVLQAWILK